MSTPKIKHVLFDLDGTLTDSSRGIVNSIQHALGNMGVEEKDELKLRSFVGPPLISTFKDNYFPEEKDQLEAVKHYRSYFADRGIFENELYAGIGKVLEELKSAGFSIALATAKPTYFANIILKHFHIHSYFDVVVGSHLGGTRTGKVEIIHEVHDQLGLPQQESCVMIGDREYDISGGKHHQMKTIGVSYGYAKDQELEKANPDHLVHSVPEMLKQIKEL